MNYVCGIVVGFTLRSRKGCVAASRSKPVFQLRASDPQSGSDCGSGLGRARDHPLAACSSIQTMKEQPTTAWSPLGPPHQVSSPLFFGSTNPRPFRHTVRNENRRLQPHVR